MNNPFASAGVILAAMLIAIVGISGGYYTGYSQGVTDERGRQDAKTVQDLTSTLGAYATLIADSNAASSAMRTALATRSALDAKTTKDLKNALAKTTVSRADCRFDDDVMRQLAAARDRAAVTAASGIRNPLPAASGGSQQPR